MNKTKTVLCIDNLDNFHKYKEGKYPSHLFYGAIEIEEANYQLLMKQCHGDNIIGMIKSLYIVIINCPDAIFCPFIRRSFILIFLLKKLRLINIPIIGFIHKTPTTKNKYTKK